jgi:hypothetical protein
MTVVMPYDRLSELARRSQLADPAEMFLHAVNLACLVLGVIILLAIIPSMLQGPRDNHTIHEAVPEKAS